MALTTTMARVRERADTLKASIKLSARQLAVLVNLSPTVLGNGLSGITYLGAEKEKELSEVTLLLMGLEETIRPLQLPSNPDDLRKLIDHIRDNKVDLGQVRATLNGIFGE